MTKEIEFTKYKTKGADYHYKEINKWNFRQFNAYLYARYLLHIDLLKQHIDNLGITGKTAIKILDVGCGDGVLLYLIKDKLVNYNLELYGIDSTEDALQMAKSKNIHTTFTKTDVYHLTFPDNFFDIVISSDVIEHVNHADVMLLEIKRVLRPKGKAIISTPIRYTEEPLDKMHFHEFFPLEYKNLMVNYFTDVSVVETHPLYNFLKYNSVYIKFIRKNYLPYKYLYHIFTLMGCNPFLRKQVKKNEMNTYMFGLATK